MHELGLEAEGHLRRMGNINVTAACGSRYRQGRPWPVGLAKKVVYDQRAKHLQNALLLVCIYAAEHLPDGRMLRLHCLREGLDMIGLSKWHLHGS